MSSQRYYFWYGEFIQHRDRRNVKLPVTDVLSHVRTSGANCSLRMWSRTDVDELVIDFTSEAEDMF